MTTRAGTRWLASFAVAVACTACSGSASARVGPIEFDVPSGWRATAQDRNSVKVTDGTVASVDATEPGTATAVFDIYVNSRQTPESYRSLVESVKGTVRSESRVKVGAEHATVLDVEGDYFAGKRTVVFLGRAGILIVYRAAFPRDDEAYTRGRPALLEAVRSIRYVR